MAIDFSMERWDRVKKNYALWWEGRLDRPLVQVCLTGRDPGRDKPDLPVHSFTSFYDPATPVEAIVDCWDHVLSSERYWGDAFPQVLPLFGAGVLAAFLGAALENSPNEQTVWFHAPDAREISDIHFEYDGDNVWFRRVLALCRAAAIRWNGLVQIAMTDLGGTLDVLSSFRPGTRLLLDLYDCPDDVERLCWEIHDLWFRYYDEIDRILQPTNPGYSAWARILSATPYYMTQCDFSYMIGASMFDRFVRPELSTTCGRLTHAFYHLDGPGQLVHLDSLLAMPEVNGIQWIAGSGQPGPLAWVDVYRRILEAGKRAQVCSSTAMPLGMDEFDALTQALGTGKGLITRIDAPIGQEEAILRRLESCGVPAA